MCLSASISGNCTSNPHQFSAHVPCTHDRGSVLLWRRCDKLCTSGFTDDVIFAHNGPYEGMSIPLQRVMSLRRRAQDNAPVASYWPRRVDSSPR